MNKKKFTKAGVGLLVSALFITGAYAFLKNTETATKTNQIKAGTASIVFSNQERVINLVDNSAIPMTKDYAIANLTSYKFDIENTGSVGLDYTISVSSEGYSNTFPDGKINVLIAPIADDETEENIKVKFASATVQRVSVGKDLTFSTVDAGQHQKYALLAFIDRETVLGDYTGNSAAFKLEVNATQHTGISAENYENLTKSQIATTITVGGESKNVDVYNIEGESKTDLLDKLSASGLTDTSNVDAIVEVKGEDYDGMNSTATFDVSSIANPGDEVVILHFNETTQEWEFIGRETVAEDSTVTGDFTSYSPVAFIVYKPDGSIVTKEYDSDTGKLIKETEVKTDGSTVETEYSNGEISNITKQEAFSYSTKILTNYRVRVRPTNMETFEPTKVTSFIVNGTEYYGTPKFVSNDTVGFGTDLDITNPVYNQSLEIMPEPFITGTNHYSFIYDGKLYEDTFEFDNNISYKLVNYVDNSHNPVKIEKYDSGDNLLEIVQDGDTSTAVQKVIETYNSYDTKIYTVTEEYSASSTLDMSNINFVDGVTTLAAGDFSTKGNLVTINDTQYRVLSVDGTQAKVMSMENYSFITEFNMHGYGVTADFNGTPGQKYNGSLLDTEMTNFYNSLSATIQNAIVPQIVNQSMYSRDYGTNAKSDFSAWIKASFVENDISGDDYYLTKKAEIEVGERKVYILDVDDVIAYLGPNSTPQDVNELFWNQRRANSNMVWLRSAYSDYSDYAFMVTGIGGALGYNSYRDSNGIRPAFVIDLSLLS